MQATSYLHGKDSDTNFVQAVDPEPYITSPAGLWRTNSDALRLRRDLRCVVMGMEEGKTGCPTW